MEEGLDKVLVNNDWRTLFCETSVIHLPNPLWIKLNEDNERIRTPWPFRFMATWLTHEDFGRVINKH